MRRIARPGLRNRDNRKLWKIMKKEMGDNSASHQKKRSFRANIKWWLLSLWMLYLLSLVLRMNKISSACVGVSIFFFTPFCIRGYYEIQRQRQRLMDVSVYIDTVLYAFLKEGKIDAALQDTVYAIEEGKLREVVLRAYRHMSQTFDDSKVAQGALAMIYEAYPTGRIRGIHEFMLHVESFGGDMNRSVELLLEDKKKWENRLLRVIEERKKMFRDVVLSVITSLLICGIIQYLPGLGQDIGNHPLTQAGTVLVILLDELIIRRAMKFLMVDWLVYDNSMEDAFYERKMQKYRLYDEKKAEMQSLGMGLPVLLLAIWVIVKGNQWLSAGLFAGALVLFHQHEIGHLLQRKLLIKEIKRAFPRWLMDLVLLLQSENVQVALAKSKEHAPGILKVELQQLCDRLSVHPQEARSYHRFLGAFQIPEVSSTMSMLYSISNGQAGNVTNQIGNLIQRNQELADEAEKQKNIDRTTGLYLLFLAPVFSASLKLLLDMTVFMFAFLATSIG